MRQRYRACDFPSTIVEPNLALEAPHVQPPMRNPAFWLLGDWTLNLLVCLSSGRRLAGEGSQTWGVEETAGQCHWVKHGRSRSPECQANAFVMSPEGYMGTPGKTSRKLQGICLFRPGRSLGKIHPNSSTTGHVLGTKEAFRGAPKGLETVVGAGVSSHGTESTELMGSHSGVGLVWNPEAGGG